MTREQTLTMKEILGEYLRRFEQPQPEPQPTEQEEGEQK
jgi:hypothetical protein